MGESLWRIALLLAGILHHASAKHHPQPHNPVTVQIPDGTFRVRVKAWYDPDGGICRAVACAGEAPPEVTRMAISTVWVQGCEMMETTIGHDKLGQPLLPGSHRTTPPQAEFWVQIESNDGKLSYTDILPICEYAIAT